MGTAATLDTIPVSPLREKLTYAATAAALQGLVATPSIFIRDLKARFTSSPTSPDLVKTYPVRPRLPLRIFFPKSYDRSSSTKLPVLFTIHGGGFVLGSPHDNDVWNSSFASEQGVLVVGLNYAKAPLNPYPHPTADLEALFLAVLADTSLPLAADKVTVAGWSAGGNLALALAQRESVRGKIRAIVPLYPVCDFSLAREVKIASRRYKPELGGFRANDTDFLLTLAPMFNWAYLPAGGDARDPGLSVGYVERDALPNKVFMVGCEMDILAHEDWKLISKLAGRTVSADVVGRQETGRMGELELDDERFSWEVKGKDGSSYRWLLVPDVVHGFDMDLSSMVNDEETLKDGTIKGHKTRKLIGDWLQEHAFAKS